LSISSHPFFKVPFGIFAKFPCSENLGNVTAGHLSEGTIETDHDLEDIIQLDVVTREMGHFLPFVY
jgi:hypothetical protein